MDAGSGSSNSVATKSSQWVELRSPSKLAKDEAFLEVFLGGIK
jgi:hypothetical protein